MVQRSGQRPGRSEDEGGLENAAEEEKPLRNRGFFWFFSLSFNLAHQEVSVLPRHFRVLP